MPQIDVILPTFNHRGFLNRAIPAILDQDFTDFSFIIVNDGSIDGTKQVLDQQYAHMDNRIVIIHNDRNMGLPAALNIGHRNGNSPYCTWVSADNISYKNHLSALYEHITKNDCDFVQSLWRGIDGNKSQVFDQREMTYNWGFSNLGPSFLYKRTVWENYNYDENAMTAEDMKFFLQAFLHPFRFGFVEECLLDYYSQSNSLTSRGNPKRSHQSIRDEIYRTVILPHIKK